MSCGRTRNRFLYQLYDYCLIVNVVLLNKLTQIGCYKKFALTIKYETKYCVKYFCEPTVGQSVRAKIVTFTLYFMVLMLKNHFDHHGIVASIIVLHFTPFFSIILTNSDHIIPRLESPPQYACEDNHKTITKQYKL